MFTSDVEKGVAYGRSLSDSLVGHHGSNLVEEKTVYYWRALSRSTIQLFWLVECIVETSITVDMIPKLEVSEAFDLCGRGTG